MLLCNYETKYSKSSSLQNRRYFLRFLRRAETSTRRARSANHARPEARGAKKIEIRATGALRARLVLTSARLKNAKITPVL